MTETNEADYQKALIYWSEIPATLDGVLGGFGSISDVDIQGSTLFLQAILSSDKAPLTKQVVDCGAGIGRTMKNLLCKYFDTVDAVEPDQKFVNNIRNYLADDEKKIGTIYNCGLQNFNPQKIYDVVWHQWVLGYLNDDDLIAHLRRCRDALSENGVIIIKENVTSSEKLERDDVDSSVTRPLKQYLKIFKKAKLKCIKQCRQINFPEGLYPVYMFALVPVEIKDSNHL